MVFFQIAHDMNMAMEQDWLQWKQALVLRICQKVCE